MTRRKFLSLLGASLAVAKAGVCALPRLPQRKNVVTIDDLYAAYNRIYRNTQDPRGHVFVFGVNQPDVLYWSHDADLDAWPKMKEVTDAEVVKRFTETQC